MRYEADFRTQLVLAALLVWFAVMSWARPRRRRRAFRAVGVTLAVWGIVATVFMSFAGEKGRLAQASPGTYSSLARFFRPVASVAAEVAGRPLVAAVEGRANRPPWGYDRLSLDGVTLDVGRQAVTVQVVAPATRIYRLHARLVREPGVPAAARLRVGVSANRTGEYAEVPADAATLPILLRSGWNDVRIEVASDARTNPLAADAPFVRVEGIRVRTGN
jgi:hypothetical protein